MKRGRAARRFFAHPAALVESDEIGEGTRVWAFAHILRGARIGRDCNVGDHCFVEGGVVVGDSCTIKNGVALWDGVTLGSGVFVGPNAVFTNVPNPRVSEKARQPFVATRVGDGATIGANAVVVCGASIGEHAFVGAGAVVTRDVPAFALVYGNPARRRGWMCPCGEKIDVRRACACGRRFRRTRGGVAPVASNAR